MQPQNFLQAINGQAVDSCSGFFVLLLGGREGCLTCVSLTQNCSYVGARCVLVCNVLSASPLQLPSVCRMVQGLTDCKVGVVILPDSVSRFLSNSLSLAVTLKCSLSLVMVALVTHHTVFNLCTNVFYSMQSFVWLTFLRLLIYLDE